MPKGSRQAKRREGMLRYVQRIQAVITRTYGIRTIFVPPRLYRKMYRKRMSAEEAADRIVAATPNV